MASMMYNLSLAELALVSLVVPLLISFVMSAIFGRASSAAGAQGQAAPVAAPKPTPGAPASVPAGKREPRAYSAAEVAKHDKEDDCWIVVKGKVYDVTDYVIMHPGGYAILNNAGGDSTEGFYGPQHPGAAYQTLEEYLIGTLESP